MMEKSFCSIEDAVLLVFLFWTKVYGTDVQINSLSDCDRTFDLDDHNIVTIQFYQKKSSENCKITITEHSSDDYPRMCIKPVKLDFNSCKLKIEVHKGLVIGGFEDEEYSCSSKSTIESCTYLSKITVIFKGESSWRDDILLRVYPAESEFKFKVRSVADTPLATILGATGGVFGLVIIISIIVCFCRAANRARYRQQQGVAMTTQGAYPQVQYNTVPPQTGDYQPSPSQGYQPPPQGYQPRPQGYQLPPQQGFQAPSPQGYQPPPQGYQPPPQGYQTQMQHGSQPPAGGYQPPVAHGHQQPSQDVGKNSETEDQSADAQKKPSAPPSDDDIPPPPYPAPQDDDMPPPPYPGY